MNSYMDIQAKNMIQILENFKNGMKYAATEDDGRIDKAEQKRLDRIFKATDKLIMELTK